MDHLNEKRIFQWGNFSLTLPELITILALFVFTIFINRIIRFLVMKYGRENKLDVGRLNSVVLLITYFIWIFAVIFALRQAGVHFAYLLGGSAALLVGLGLGLQEIFKDIVAGIIILFEGKVRKGDILELQGVIGSVNSLGLRTTELIRRDGVKIVVPNNKLISDYVVNWSHTKKPARHAVQVGVDFSSDVRQVEVVLLGCLNQLPGIEKQGEFAPLVRLIDFGPSAYQFELLLWSYEYFRFEQIKSNLRYLIVDAFREHNIRIPFPHLVTVPGNPDLSGRELKD
jgi:small-conductance mechanosensitive channel